MLFEDQHGVTFESPEKPQEVVDRMTAIRKIMTGGDWGIAKGLSLLPWVGKSQHCAGVKAEEEAEELTDCWRRLDVKTWDTCVHWRDVQDHAVCPDLHEGSSVIVFDLVCVHNLTG